MSVENVGMLITVFMLIQLVMVVTITLIQRRNLTDLVGVVKDMRQDTRVVDGLEKAYMTSVPVVQKLIDLVTTITVGVSTATDGTFADPLADQVAALLQAITDRQINVAPVDPAAQDKPFFTGTGDITPEPLVPSPNG